ncbi:hypothetical protein M758_3G095000 [Ceratodon purpureus]|nr:hypothetical protein M758_3G095000 [Ceratodon purpureus]
MCLILVLCVSCWEAKKRTHLRWPRFDRVLGGRKPQFAVRSLSSTFFHSQFIIYIFTSTLFLLKQSYPNSLTQTVLPNQSYPISLTQLVLPNQSYPISLTQSVLPNQSYPISLTQSVLPNQSYPNSFTQTIFTQTIFTQKNFTQTISLKQFYLNSIAYMISFT